jgi:hypothetical protein
MVSAYLDTRLVRAQGETEHKRATALRLKTYYNMCNRTHMVICYCGVVLERSLLCGVVLEFELVRRSTIFRSAPPSNCHMISCHY